MELTKKDNIYQDFINKPSHGELNKIGMIVFVASETVFLLALGIAFLIIKNNSPRISSFELSITDYFLASGALIILLASSLTFYKALKNIKNNKFSFFEKALFNTTILGFLFLALQIIQAARWLNLGISISSGQFAAAFYVLVAIHALHIIIALVWIIYIYLQARQKKFYSENYAQPERAMIFWQFVVFIWPVLFLIIYF